MDRNNRFGETQVHLKCIAGCGEIGTFKAEFAPLKESGQGNFLCAKCLAIKNMGKERIKSEIHSMVMRKIKDEILDRMNLIFSVFYSKSRA